MLCARSSLSSCFVPPALQRCRELGGSGRELLTASAPEAVRHVSADQAGAMLEAVNSALAQFGGASAG